jgi:hypothetical protein
MSEFVTALRDGVADAQRELQDAEQDGRDYDVHRYSARLLDLLDRAAASGIDTTDWVAATALSVASGHCA